MRVPAVFVPDPSEIDRLVAEHPLAQLVSAGPSGLTATPLPLLLETDGEGRAWLVGHFAGSNPQIGELEANPDALAIFMGPHDYMSPSWLSDRTQAPTWNYATVQMKLRVRIDRSADAARAAVNRLTSHLEAGRPAAWSSTELGPRYETLLRGVVAFRAEVLDIRAKFKLGQNERDDVLRQMLARLGPDTPLHKLMKQANGRRLSPAREEEAVPSTT